jgi:tol-pal system protein YbgF
MRHSPFTAAVMAAVFVFPAFADELQLAQVEVIESSPAIRAIGQPYNTAAKREDSNSTSTGNTATTPNSTGAANVQGELYYQLQILQEEVQALRGLVEEQAHQLQQLKQQRMDDYVDLDRRISQLSQSRSGAADTATTSAVNNSSSVARTTDQKTPAVDTAMASGEFASYSAAVDLATKQQEFDRAITALNEHLKQYPAGRYAANAHYWLGQIFFVQGKMEEARQAFSRVVDGYPDHNKASEARYKLGQVYFTLGDKAQAKSFLEQVASGNSDSAPLAKHFLRQNYQ